MAKVEYKPDYYFRYTNFWDPDTGRWAGWEQAFFYESRAVPQVIPCLNKTEVYTGDTITLTLATIPGVTARIVDVYVALQLPDGTLLFWLGDMNFTQKVVPVVRSWTVTSFSDEIFRHTFSDGERPGIYSWFVAFTDPGTSTIIGTIAQVPFTFVP